MRGVHSHEIEKADCVVIWGTNAVATQVNLMTHAMRARKQRGAKIVAIDIYDTETMRQADLALKVRPGSDGALACAVMHVLFRDGLADRDYMRRYTDDPEALAAHVRRAIPPGPPGSRGLASPTSRRSPRWSGATSARSSGSATAFRASATARPTCTPRCASPP